MKKKIFIILFITISAFVIFLGIFWQNIIDFIYDIKYDNVNRIEKNLIYNKETGLIEENSIDIGDFNIILSNIEYTENKLNFDLKFSHSNSLSNVGYILRVYDKDYFWGDRFNGQTSLSNTEWIMNQKSFYKKTFRNIDFAENMLLNAIHQNYQSEVLESENTLLHKISFNLPEEFSIKSPLNIVLFDINYQNMGDKNFYKINKHLSEIKYTIDNI